MVNNKMKEELKQLKKQSTENYFKEDKIVMLDESLMRIKSIMFYLYDLIFFGNKIIIPKEMLKRVEANKKRLTYKILSDNSNYLLKAMEKDKELGYQNYQVVDIGNKGKKFEERVYQYLKNNPNVVYLLESQKTYDYLKQKGLSGRVKLLKREMRIMSICKNKASYFSTLGFVVHEDGKMYIIKRPGSTLIKVYDKDDNEKIGEKIEVEVKDTVLVRSTKDLKYSFNIYEVISRHTRNSAVKIIWTDMMKGQTTNFYIKKLDEKYQKMIADNAIDN